MNEIVDSYLNGEYDIQEVEVVSDNEYYFIDREYFKTKDMQWVS